MEFMSSRSKKILRALAEIGFIVILFYTNLLMGEFTRAHMAERPLRLVSALYDILTTTNALIGLTGALVGYLFIEGIRTYLQ